MNADAIAEYGRRTRPISNHVAYHAVTAVFARHAVTPVIPATSLELFPTREPGATSTTDAFH